MKPYTTIQLNVKVTDTTADQIKRLAAFNQITVAEQLRRFIEEGCRSTAMPSIST